MRDNLCGKLTLSLELEFTPHKLELPIIFDDSLKVTPVSDNFTFLMF